MFNEKKQIACFSVLALSLAFNSSLLANAQSPSGTALRCENPDKVNDMHIDNCHIGRVSQYSHLYACVNNRARAGDEAYISFYLYPPKESVACDRLMTLNEVSSVIRARIPQGDLRVGLLGAAKQALSEGVRLGGIVTFRSQATLKPPEISSSLPVFTSPSSTSISPSPKSETQPPAQVAQSARTSRQSHASDDCRSALGHPDGSARPRYSGIVVEDDCKKPEQVGTRMYFVVGKSRVSDQPFTYGATAPTPDSSVDIIERAIGDNFERGSLRVVGDPDCPATKTWAVLLTVYPNDTSVTYRTSAQVYGCGFSDPKVAIRKSLAYCNEKGLCPRSSKAWIDWKVIQNTGASSRFSRHPSLVRCYSFHGNQRIDPESCKGYQDALN